MPDVTEFSPTISIITVCYNESPQNLRKTFDSIKSQSYAHIQWIVIDGGSNEETVSAIREYSDDIDVLVSEPDNGIYDAMNKGLQHATGEFINYMNVGDRFMSPHTVQDVAGFIYHNPGYDCFHGDAKFTNQASGSSCIVMKLRSVNLPNLYFTTICHQSLFANRSVFEKIGGFDQHYTIVADKEWVVRSVKAGAMYIHTNMLICEYDTSGISNTHIKEQRMENSLLKKRHYKSWQKPLLYLRWKAARVMLRIITLFGDNRKED